MKHVILILALIVLIEGTIVAVVAARAGVAEGAMVAAALFLVTAFGSAPLVLRAISNRR